MKRAPMSWIDRIFIAWMAVVAAGSAAAAHWAVAAIAASLAVAFWLVSQYEREGKQFTSSELHMPKIEPLRSGFR